MFTHQHLHPPLELARYKVPQRGFGLRHNALRLHSLIIQ
jgi:hypothetical protein